MKKILTPLLAALLLAPALSSCTKEDDAILESTVIRTKEVTVRWNDWTVQDGVNYVFHEIEWPTLTDNAIYNGNISVYVYDNGLQNPLPYVYPTEVTYDDGTSGIIPENLRFDMEPGRLTIIMQDLDGYQPTIDRNTNPMTFRIVAQIPVSYILQQ